MNTAIANNRKNPKPRVMASKADALSKARLFLSAEAARRQALSMWLAVKPQLRLETALELFHANEVTLERAAEIAGMNRWVFHEELKRRGIKIVVDTASAAELDAAVVSIGKER
jgi:predicted HTH domain antitoxin